MSLTWGEQPPSEPRLRRLRHDDAPRAYALTQLVDWGHTVVDWERLINWGGRGCFCIAQGDELLATATTTGYGQDRAWLGMVLTHPDHQHKGFGRQVTLAAVDYLQDRGVEHILLDATEQGRPFYEKLGFHALYSVEVWIGPASSYLGSHAARLRHDDLPAAIALDADVFGVSRGRIIRRLVADFPRAAWVDKEGGEVVGFALAQTRGDTAHIGPWIHRSPWGAEKLLRTALEALLGKQVRVDIPDCNTQATGIAHDFDLRYQRHCTRMIYGKAHPPWENLRDQYGVASVATG